MRQRSIRKAGLNKGSSHTGSSWEKGKTTMGSLQMKCLSQMSPAARKHPISPNHSLN
jgi:hypothetical protein